ncbi:MAG: PAS domain S-box protein [Desulfamplus sp.]|nr:PAS domain S-box protein [Desulfamplus sp.]
MQNSVDGLQALELTLKEKSWIEAHPNITVAIMSAWPPLNSSDDKEGAKGIGVDYMNLLGRRLGIDFKIIPGPFADNLKAVQEKRIDALMDVTPKPEREVFLNFTQPYIEVPHVIVGRSDGPFHYSEEDLRGKTLALELGFGNVKYFAEKYPDVKVVEYPDTTACLKAVSSGEAQTYAGNRAVITYIMAMELLTNLQVQGELSKKGSILAIGVRKDWPEMASILDKALVSITETEKFQIIGKWVGQETDERIELTQDESEWIASQSSIRYMGKTEWLPFESFEKNGQYTGIVADHIKLIEKRLGISFKTISPMQHNDSTEKYPAEEVDIILSDTKDIKETKAGKKFKVTKPYLSNPVVVVMKKTERFITDLNQLQDNKVAVIQNFSYSREIRKAFPNLSFIVVDNILAGLKGVSSGEFNALLCPLALGTYKISELGYYDLQIVGKTDIDMTLSFAVRPDWEVLEQILNKVIDSISKQDHQEIMNHYVKEQVIRTGLDFRTVLKWILPFVSLLILIIILSIFYNRRLHKEVLERKRAQLKTLANERKINAMGQAMADALVMIDGLGKVFFWNQAAEHLFGYTSQEAMGMDFHQIAVPNEEREKAWAGLRHFAATGQGVVFGSTIQTTALNRSGLTFPVEVSLSPFQVENEWFAVGSVRDISDRKRAEEAIRESEKRFRGYFEHSQIGMAVTHPQKGWIEANGRLQDMLGYTIEELRHTTWADLTHPEDLQADVNFFEQMLADEIDVYSMDKRFIRKDGEILYTNISISCLRDENRAVSLVLASFLDITDRKQAEQEIKSSNAQLKSILDMCPVGVAFSTKGIIHFVNPRFRDMFGVKVGDPSPDLYVNPEERNQIVAKIQSEGKVENYEIQMYNSSREVRDILITYLPIKYEGEDGILGWLLDITERKKNEKQMEEQVEDLKQFSRLTINREERMIELKEEINSLMGQLGKGKKYKIVE